MVRDSSNTPITDIQKLNNQQNITLQFKEDNRIGATIGNADKKQPQDHKKTITPPKDQGSLF